MSWFECGILLCTKYFSWVSLCYRPFKAVFPVLFVVCVTLWFLFWGVLSCVLPCSLFSCFSVLFSIVITSIREERAGLYASRAIVCLSCMRYSLSLFSSYWCQGWLRLVNVTLPGLLTFPPKSTYY